MIVSLSISALGDWNSTPTAAVYGHSCYIWTPFPSEKNIWGNFISAHVWLSIFYSDNRGTIRKMLHCNATYNIHWCTYQIMEIRILSGHFPFFLAGALTYRSHLNSALASYDSSTALPVVPANRSNALAREGVMLWCCKVWTSAKWSKIMKPT